MTDLQTIGRTLRATADRNMLQKGDVQALVERREPPQDETPVHVGGHECYIILRRLLLSEEHGISCYALFIRSALGPFQQPPPDVCDQICRAIYDAEWKEGPRAIPGMRWYIRARIEKQESFAA